MARLKFSVRTAFSLFSDLKLRLYDSQRLNAPHEFDRTPSQTASRLERNLKISFRVKAVWGQAI